MIIKVVQQGKKLKKGKGKMVCRKREKKGR
jgi:hypothetical protein